jgi:disulfide bond formation protein DsbB
VSFLSSLHARDFALIILAVASATIAGAWIFQFLGYAPCELCLEERIPYYIGVGLAALTVVFAVLNRKSLVQFGLGALALVFLGSAVFGAYHAGVEWGFWRGPTDCTGSIEQPALVSDFLKQLQTTKVVRCDDVALRVLGLSLAAWNALISTGLAALAVFGVLQTFGPRTGRDLYNASNT